MLKQLSEFAHNIQQQKAQDETIWEQLPAGRLIEEASRLASRYAAENIQKSPALVRGDALHYFSDDAFLL